ncbi:hypothetical protein ACL9RF_06720 [Sphingobacterium sp. Mn56C]|uniref:hypothetical protein n=1 Tax=Sphingobacterium sp. Mn56C TaxID=3395261 RepID=UPI003BE6E249
MLKKIVLNLIVLFSILSLSSCFEVVEDVDLKNDGSGSIKATINLSKSKTKVASLMKLEKVEGMKVPSRRTIETEVQTIVKLLQQTAGISNVKYTLDFNNFIGSLSCDFKDIAALNTFTKTLSTHFKNNFYSYSSYSYNTATKVLSRNYVYAAEAKKELDRLKPDSQKAFQEAGFTSIYRFQGVVDKQTNPNGKISANKKAVMLQVSILDLVKGNVSLTNQISLVK